MWHVQPGASRFENSDIKWGRGAGKIEPQYFWLI